MSAKVTKALKCKSFIWSDLHVKCMSLEAFINAALNELSTVSVDNSVHETLRTSAAPVF